MTAAKSVCTFLKNLSKLVSFCVAILILKMEENMQYFQHIRLYYFKKGKNTTEMQKKDLCSVWRRCCDRSNVSKVACEVLCWRFLTGGCSTVRQTGWGCQSSNGDIENNQCYTMREIANILKISSQ